MDVQTSGSYKYQVLGLEIKGIRILPTPNLTPSKIFRVWIHE